MSKEHDRLVKTGGKVELQNPFLKDLEIDHFHHFGFSTGSLDVKKVFSDVKFVCVSGSVNRVKNFARYVQAQLNLGDGNDIQNLCLSDRYVMFKVGPVLAASHGMGVPSACILINEVLKLLHYAGSENVRFFRLGTSGGLGLEPGTVVITRDAVDGLLRPVYETIVLGERVEHSTVNRSSLTSELVGLSIKDNSFDIVLGDTMCCHDFYEGQGRLDGAFCEFDEEKKNAFLTKAREAGVRNIEMESLVFMAMCNRAKVECAVVCVCLVNRLAVDQVKISRETLEEFERRPWHIVVSYIKHKLNPGQ